MKNIAIYLHNRPFPILIIGGRMTPADLLLSGTKPGHIEGLALKMDGKTLEEPLTVEVPFDEIQRLAISTFEGAGETA